MMTEYQIDVSVREEKDRVEGIRLSVVLIGVWAVVKDAVHVEARMNRGSDKAKRRFDGQRDRASGQGESWGIRSGNEVAVGPID